VPSEQLEGCCCAFQPRSTVYSSLLRASSTMGKKGKGKKVEFLTDAASLKPFEVSANDMVSTPLGVHATVIGVREGALWLKWPGGIESPASPAPQKARNKAELETFGYSRRPQSAHIQRAIDDRLQAQYQQRRYGGPGPKTAALKLPLGPHGAAGSSAFAAFANSNVRPATAPP